MNLSSTLYCFHWVGSFHKFLLGVVLQIVRVVALMLIEFEARRLYNIRHYGSNMTMQCMFWEEDGAWSSTVDGWWMAIPNILNSMSLFYLLLVPLNSSVLKPLTL